MDQHDLAALKSLKGVCRVDGVSEVKWDYMNPKVGFVLSEINPEVDDPYSAAARVDRPPELLALSPGWLSVLTVGSIWKAGQRISKPDELEVSYRVDTRQAELYSFAHSVKLRDAYTLNGIAAPDFLDRKTHRDLFSSLYVIVPVLDRPDCEWLVVPCSELLRFYMGPTRRLSARVLRGEIDQLTAPPSVESGVVTLHERVELKRLEALILARAYANPDTYLAEMKEIHSRLQGISVRNSNSKGREALTIKAHFPFEGITDLRISGLPMKLASDQENAIFAAEIFSCTAPHGFWKLIIERANDLGTGGDKAVAGKPDFYPLGEDNIDESISDEPADARLSREAVTRYATPFPWADLIEIESRRKAGERDWHTQSPKIGVDATGYSANDGNFETVSSGVIGIDSSVEAPSLANNELINFVRMFTKLEATAAKHKWTYVSRTPNECINVPSSNHNISAFPQLLGKRWKWHLVKLDQRDDSPSRTRQIAIFEMQSYRRAEDYFYVLEMEVKGDSHCTALLRKKGFGRLGNDTLNDFLKLTAYNNGWPDFSSTEWPNERAKKLANGLVKKHSLLVGKSKHPIKLVDWDGVLLKDISKWLKSRM